jgi:uncharacterized repeat protein (TIGR02543 family)
VIKNFRLSVLLLVVFLISCAGETSIQVSSSPNINSSLSSLNSSIENSSFITTSSISNSSNESQSNENSSFTSTSSISSSSNEYQSSNSTQNSIVSSISNYLFTVTFDSLGGSTVNSQFIESNGFLSPPSVSREGHTLEGWYTSINNGSTLEFKWDFFIDKVNFDFTLYAKWNVNQYTITFETNGGNSIQSQTYDFAESLSLLTPIRAGHTFAGWYTNAGLTTSFTSNTMPASDLNLYAKWTINQYTITFETNGGSSVASITGNYGVSVSAPNDPTREGYTFNGWYSDTNLTQTYLFDTMPASNITLYAKWNVNQYTITFETYGGNSIPSQTYDFAESLSLLTPIRAGHIFAGWYTNAGLTTSFTSNTMPASDLNLYAKWTINQYTITFETNGGTSVQTQTNNFNASLSIPTPTKVGHSFVGWFTDTELTQPFTMTMMPAYNLTIFAKWMIIWESLSLGRTHTSALSTNGQVFIWGSNSEGILDDTKLSNITTPTNITSRFSLAPSDKVISLSMGGYHSSVLTSTGRVFTWGLNLYGGLGAGYTTKRSDPNEITSSFSLDPSDKITSLYLGAYHSSALSATGRVFMWGLNNAGQLGNGNTTNRGDPTEITSRFPMDANDKIISLSLGTGHSSALSATGRVFMWGQNNRGQLGNGTTINRNIPTEITSKFSLDQSDRITLLSLGEGHSSSLSENGRAFMWGNNGDGQLGDGTITYRNVPTEITSSFSLDPSDKITSLFLGSFHSSALSATGRVFMWGVNNAGQLGDGTITNRNVPTEITSRFSIDASDKITALSLGAGHSSALTLTGRVFMWGQNYFGELGDNTNTDSYLPIMI